jgi:hypothetical protein
LRYLYPRFLFELEGSGQWAVAREMIGVCGNSPVSEGWKEEINRVNTARFVNAAGLVKLRMEVAGKHFALTGPGFLCSFI